MATTASEKKADAGPAHRAAVHKSAFGALTTSRNADGFRRRLLAVADAIAVVLVGVSYAVIGPHSADMAFWAIVALPAWIVLAKVIGLYDQDHRALRHLTVDELSGIAVWALAGISMTALMSAMLPTSTLSARGAIQGWVIAVVGGLTIRGAARHLWRSLVPPERTVIIGSGSRLAETRRKLELFPDIHVTVVAEMDYGAGTGMLDSVEAVERVIVASPSLDEGFLSSILAWCRAHKAKLTVIPPAPGAFGTAVQLRHIADLPVVEYNTWDVSRSTLVLKRALDVVGSLFALVLTSPLLLGAALAVMIEARPILFVQTRAGKDGKPFRLYKFRTMVPDAERRLAHVVSLDQLVEPMFKLTHDPRVTRVGRFLRRTSLDELPQLVNVLKGDMSLVGPRPEQLDLVERYGPEDRFRLVVKPGVTGPMQVFGRADLTFRERLAVEREYVENLTIGRDLRILLMTLPVVSRMRGAY